MRAGLFTVFLIAAYIFAKEMFADVASESSGVYLAAMVMVMVPLVYAGLSAKNRDRRAEYKRRSTQTVLELTSSGAIAPGITLGPTAPGLPASGGAAPDFVLFLRPFLADLVEVRNPDLDGWAAFLVPLYKFILPETVSLDDGLRMALPGPGRLVAISTQTEQLGATKIARSESDWQEAFEQLAPRAKAIVIVPGVRPGTEWEIDRIVQLGLIRRCLFLLMPLPQAVKHDAREVFELAAVSAMLARHGLHLPQRTPAGDKIACGDAVAFADDLALSVHGRGVVTQGFLANTLRPKRLRQCMGLMP